MRILHLTSHLNIGGITRYVLSLAQRQVERGHRVLIVSDEGNARARAEALGVTHWCFPLHTSAEFSPQVWWSTQQLLVRLRQEPVDLIHAHTRVSQVVADSLARHLHIPYVTTWHGIYRRRLGRRLWPCMGEITIAISELVRQHLLTVFHVPESRVRRIHNGVETAHYAALPDSVLVETYRQHWQLPAHHPVVGGIGRLASGRVKGFDTLLVATALLAQRVPELQVLIVGDGPRRPFLEDVAIRLGIRHRVHFVGEAQDVRIPLALMNLFVFTSRWPEAFGLTLVEAMAAGKPVVATQTGAVPEVISHDVNGWLVPSDNPSAVADGILRLLHDRAAAMRLGRQAQQRARDAFDLDRLVEQIETVYHELV